MVLHTTLEFCMMLKGADLYIDDFFVSLHTNDTFFILIILLFYYYLETIYRYSCVARTQHVTITSYRMKESK